MAPPAEDQYTPPSSDPPHPWALLSLRSPMKELKLRIQEEYHPTAQATGSSCLLAQHVTS